MNNLTNDFLIVGASNEIVKNISTEELIGRTIPCAVMRIDTLPSFCEDGKLRAKECLRVVAEELGKRGIVETNKLLEIME